MKSVAVLAITLLSGCLEAREELSTTTAPAGTACDPATETASASWERRAVARFFVDVPRGARAEQPIELPDYARAAFWVAGDDATGELSVQRDARYDSIDAAEQGDRAFFAARPHGSPECALALNRTMHRCAPALHTRAECGEVVIRWMHVVVRGEHFLLACDIRGVAAEEICATFFASLRPG